MKPVLGNSFYLPNIIIIIIEYCMTCDIHPIMYNI